MIKIQEAIPADIPALIELAHQTWHATYSSIISKEQIEYMLERFYNEALIASQLQHHNHVFFTAKEDGLLKGYCHAINETSFMKLSKLYIHPSAQGTGIGQLLLQELERNMRAIPIHCIQLNVNRYNPARFFYEKMGFTIIQRVDISLHTFWLNDYIMEKLLIDLEKS